MRNTIRLKILFLVGVFVFIGRNAYAGYTTGFGIGSVHPDKHFNVLMSIVVVMFVILMVTVFKAMKERETNKAPNEGAKSDESVRNFKKHYDEKTKQ